MHIFQKYFKGNFIGEISSKLQWKIDVSSFSAYYTNRNSKNVPCICHLSQYCQNPTFIPISLASILGMSHQALDDDNFTECISLIMESMACSCQANSLSFGSLYYPLSNPLNIVLCTVYMFFLALVSICRQCCLCPEFQ